LAAFGEQAGMDSDRRKREAAAKALEFVRPGMRLGLGTGSTARHFVELLGQRVRQGLDVIGVPTSAETERQAKDQGVPLTTLQDHPELDLTVDGADEIDDALTLIKGGGGALLREKIVAAASKTMIVIADESKVVPVLGRFPLPVEVVRFGMAATERAIARQCGPSGKCAMRQKDGHAFVTDEGHCIIDVAMGRIDRPEDLAHCLSQLPGVVEHGLFVGMADLAIIAGAQGVRVLERAPARNYRSRTNG
jgi:ribose 5-phosphate isomerase A